MFYSIFKIALLLNCVINCIRGEVIGNQRFNIGLEQCEDFLSFLNKNHYVCVHKRQENKIGTKEINNFIQTIDQYVDIEGFTNFIEKNNQEIKYTSTSIQNNLINIHSSFLNNFEDYISSLDTFVKTSFIILNDRSSYSNKISKILSNFGEVVGYQVSKKEFERVITKNTFKLSSSWKNFIMETEQNYKINFLQNYDTMLNFFTNNNEEINEIVEKSFDKTVNKIHEYIDNFEGDDILLQDLVISIFPEKVDDCSNFMKEKYMIEDIVCISVEKEDIFGIFNYYYESYFKK